jgi:hypothetical protein
VITSEFRQQLFILVKQFFVCLDSIDYSSVCSILSTSLVEKISVMSINNWSVGLCCLMLCNKECWSYQTATKYNLNVTRTNTINKRIDFFENIYSFFSFVYSINTCNFLVMYCILYVYFVCTVIQVR